MHEEAITVVPESICAAAMAGRRCHEELADTYATTLSQLWDAEAGWVGRSGSALSALVESWRSAAADQHRMINAHHDGIISATTIFAEMDRGAAVRRLTLHGNTDAGGH